AVTARLNPAGSTTASSIRATATARRIDDMKLRIARFHICLRLRRELKREHDRKRSAEKYVPETITVEREFDLPGSRYDSAIRPDRIRVRPSHRGHARDCAR